MFEIVNRFLQQKFSNSSEIKGFKTSVVELDENIAQFTENDVHLIPDEDSGGVSNGVATVAPESSTTSHSGTMQASDTRGLFAFGGWG